MTDTFAESKTKQTAPPSPLLVSNPATIEQALADLLWLSKRLSGILQLKDLFEDFHALQNQAQELYRAKQETEAALQGLLDQKKSLEAGIERTRKELVAASQEAKAIVSRAVREAELEANRIRDKAAAEAADITASARRKLDELTNEVMEKSDLVRKLSHEADAALARRDKILAEIEALKSRL